MLVENLPVPFDRRVWMEARTLAHAGYRVSVICPIGSYKEHYECLDGIHIYRYWLPSLSGIVGHIFEYSIALSATFLLSLVVLARHGFDVIHSANPPDLFFIIGWLYYPFGKKYVFDHHDLVPEVCLTRWSGWKQTLMYRISLLLERATFARADLVISTNESYRRVAIERGQLSPNDAVVVRSGPSLERFSAREPDPGLRNGHQYLVAYLGVMGPNDGLDVLLEVIRIVVHDLNRDGILFVLIGSGDCQGAIMQQASALGLDDHVKFTGRIPDAEVISYLSTADVGVAPDPKDELNNVSTMNKIIEYMAIGLPVLCFDLIEHRVSAGEAGCYARATSPGVMAEELVSLLEDPERRKTMAAVARRRFCEVLAWEHQAPRLVAAYERLDVH